MSHPYFPTERLKREHSQSYHPSNSNSVITALPYASAQFSWKSRALTQSHLLKRRRNNSRQLIASCQVRVTSSLELVLIELGELAKDLLLVVRREAHSGIHHLQAEHAHHIHAEL